ncbi:hypothetical protein [Nonomuraea sp. NPDC050643]
MAAFAAFPSADCTISGISALSASPYFYASNRVMSNNRSSGRPSAGSRSL